MTQVDKTLKEAQQSLHGIEDDEVREALTDLLDCLALTGCRIFGPRHQVTDCGGET